MEVQQGSVDPAEDRLDRIGAKGRLLNSRCA
jgi:hypothetical protein